MHGIGLDDPLQQWFDFRVPSTTVPPAFIMDALNTTDSLVFKPSAKTVWLGKLSGQEIFTQSRKGNSREMMNLFFTGKRGTEQIRLPRLQAEWLIRMLPQLALENKKTYTLQELKDDYEKAGLGDFELFWDNKPVTNLARLGLLKL
jgi:hypothetical protein